MLAPVVLFVFKRLEHTRRVVEALQRNDMASESTLYIFADQARNEEEMAAVQAVRKYISRIEGFKEKVVAERDENYGLARNILEGVSQVLAAHGKAIVLEDDLLCSPHFLRFMNRALDYYQADQRIFSVSAYNPPMRFPEGYQHSVYLNYRNSSWGWGTWSDRWQKVDWAVSDYPVFVKDKTLRKAFNRGGEDLAPMLDKQMWGLLNSWSIRFTYAHFRHGAYSLCPVRSLIKSIGHDGSGTHSDNTNRFEVEIDEDFRDFDFTPDLFINEEIVKEFRRFYGLSLKKKIKNTLLTAYHNY